MNTPLWLDCDLIWGHLSLTPLARATPWGPHGRNPASASFSLLEASLASECLPATHDGRSFMIDGRRVWLVSGRIPYARLPRETWGDRIHAAKLAGLNTIETPVFWNRHEARPGRFDFTGDNDLRHFIDRIGKAGMYCILSMGPFIDLSWEFGGCRRGCGKTHSRPCGRRAARSWRPARGLSLWRTICARVAGDGSGHGRADCGLAVRVGVDVRAGDAW